MRRCPDKTIARIGAAALGLGAVLAVAERPVAAQAPRDLPTFPSQVELITVDAVVLDSSGKPVPDLTKEDFVVTEDGRPQEIASFESFVLEAPDVPPPPTAVASNETAGRASNGRAFAILVDDVRIAPDHTEMVRTAI